VQLLRHNGPSQPNLSPSPHRPTNIRAHLHRYRRIGLHGRGSDGPDFASELFEARNALGQSLPQHFPTWKWVFPSSQERFSTVFQEELDQWFDIYSLNNPSEREGLQVEGLRVSVEFVLGLFEDEVQIVGAGRLVLGGISQGCATSLHALLAGRYRLGGYFGISGWIPFKAQIDGVVKDASKSRLNSHVFEFYQTTLGLESPGSIPENVADLKLQTPMFLCHGADDEYVDVSPGRQIRTVLERMGMTVTWREYEKCGHWIKEPEGSKQ